MKSFLTITGFEMEEKEMQEVKNVIRKMNKRRKKEGCEKIDYIFMTNKKTCISRGLADK